MPICADSCHNCFVVDKNQNWMKQKKTSIFSWKSDFFFGYIKDKSRFSNMFSWLEVRYLMWKRKEEKKVLKFRKEKGQIMWDWEKMVLSLRQFWLFPYLFHPLSQGKLIACFFVSPLSLKQDYRENYLTPWWKMCVK